jgi:hypothetical protein
MAALLIGISGGLLGLYKYFSDKREKELREWQKVVIYKIFRQNEMKALSFTDVLEKYRIEAQAFLDVDLKKKEVSENALRRVLLELASSNILSMEPSDSFRLKVVVEKADPRDLLQQVNRELVRMVAPNPFVYTIDEVLKEIAPKVGVEIPLLRNDLKQAVTAGKFVVDEAGRIAFPR